MNPNRSQPGAVPSTADVIDNTLESTRQALQEGQNAIANVQELQDRARRKMDWRAQVVDNPLLMLGLALGGGLLLTSLFRGRSRY